MPRVDVLIARGTPAERTAAVSDAVHTAMEKALVTAPAGRFHAFTEMDQLHRHPDAMPAGEEFWFLTFYLAPRPPEVVAALHREVVEELGTGAGIAPQDVSIIIVEVPSQNWWWHGHG